MIPPIVVWRAFRVWRAWRRGRPKPLSVTYFVNGACNLRCRGCFFFEHPPESLDADAELGTHEALALVDDLARLGVPFLELVGGEPFLRRDLLELARHARKRGLWCGVTTNGTRLDAAVAAEARRTFRTVFVSLDGFEAAHDVVRGAGGYARALAGLDHLLAAPGRALVGVSTILTPENLASLPDFAAFLRARGVGQWVLSSALAPAPAVDPAAAAPVLARLARLRREDPEFFPQEERFFAALLGLQRGEGRYGCHVDQLLHVSVTPSGETSACCLWPVPLGPASQGELAATLARAAREPSRFEPVDRCSGCARHDYAYTMALFQRPLPRLVGEGLRLALGRGLASPSAGADGERR